MMDSSTTYRDAALTLIEGCEAITRELPKLRIAAERWGQAAELLELPIYFGLPVFPRRQPLLLLFSAKGTGEPCAAVMVYAFAATWFHHSLLSNADRLGRRGIYGPASARVEIAAVAAREFLRRGSVLVNLNFLGEEPSIPAEGVRRMQSQQGLVQRIFAAEKSVTWKLFSRIRYLDLPLSPTLDETLRRVGKRTRRNIRYYRRLSEKDLGVRFHSCAELELQEFLAVNRRSHHALGDKVARWRYAAANKEPGFLAGIRTRDGRWISLAGGWRIGERVILDWQMNDLHFPRFSVSLVLRGYLLEYFGQQGVRWFAPEGGTAHTMAEAFRRRNVFHLQAERRVVWLKLLAWTLRRFLPGRGITLSLFGGYAAARRSLKG